MKNNDFKNLLETLVKYINNKSSFKKIEEDFNKFFINSDFDFTDKQEDILENINEDIAMTVLEDKTKKEDSDYISEFELKAKIKDYLKILEA